MAEQDDGMEWAHLDVPLAVGTRIVMKPCGSRKASCRITEIVPLQEFRTRRPCRWRGCASIMRCRPGQMAPSSGTG